MAGREPPAALRPFVKRIAGYEEWSARPQCQRQLPQSHFVVIIELGPPIGVALAGEPSAADRHPGGFAAGLGDRFAITAHTGRQCGIQVDLTPTGARRLFGRPLSELRGRIVALRDLWPAAHRDLAERLAELPDWAARLDLVEDVLVRRVAGARLDTARVDWALGRIEASGGTVDVGSLARELGHSRKHVIALFRDQVGVPPKLFARLVRFGRIMDRARRAGSEDWAELAAAHGYYDQAHLARDVRRFSGLTPTQARASLPGSGDLLG